MSFFRVAAVAVIAGVLGAGVATVAFYKSGETARPQSAYDRVLKTRTIRCAYMLWPQFFERDPNTGAFSGYEYEMMEAVAQSLGIKVEWTAEIAVGTQIESLLAGKADAVCGGETTIMTNAALQLAYTEPFAYFPVYAYVRADDARFTDNNERVNAEDVKVSAIDGDISREILSRSYTRAIPVPLPQLADGSQMMLDVMAHKADVVLNDDLSMTAFQKNNPGKLRKLSDQAIVVIPATFSALRTEMPLVDMLSQGIKNIRDRGIEALINGKYGFGKDLHVYTVARHYEVK
ncbi:MAG: transporter substrate-binding domain-containing protein [Alphaproteobacteria bacterium]|nr:transporter substrate-binding domain-containing protein [Alphaproteobacteria bacterium]